MLIADVAKICHEANRAYCQTLGDDSQVPWEHAPAWQRESAMKGVDFCLLNPNAPASANHEAWLEVKRAEGWKYGKVKDADKKEHPCFVPFEQLSPSQQAKDHLFKAIVAVFASHVTGEQQSAA